MFERLKTYITDATATMKTKIEVMKRPIKWVVFSYFAMVALLVLTYYGAWLWLWYIGKGALGDLLSIIKEMVGTSMVAFVTFIAGCMVDTNNNGVPDRFEKEEDKRR